jgi:hypothetical protein
MNWEKKLKIPNLYWNWTKTNCMKNITNWAKFHKYEEKIHIVKITNCFRENNFIMFQAYTNVFIFKHGRINLHQPKHY